MNNLFPTVEVLILVSSSFPVACIQVFGYQDSVAWFRMYGSLGYLHLVA